MKISKGVKFGTVVSFTTNIVLSASLGILWGMINSLSLITHLALMNLSIPALTMYAFQLIFSLS